MIGPARTYALIGLALAMWSPTWAQDADKPGDQPLKRPVIFSYNYPWGSDKNPNSAWTDPWFMDFSKVRLSTANMVDHVDVEKFRANWRTPHRRILARTGIGGYEWPVEQIVDAWDKALSADGIDGMAVDEFIGSKVTPELMDRWIEAVRQIRQRHPDKVLAYWTDSGLGRVRLFGQAHKPLLVALRDCADFVMPEIYYREKSVPDFATNPDPFPEFRRKAQEWEDQAPGILPKILMGLGTVQNADWGYDNLEDIDYGKFLAKQVEVCATDPVLKQMAGLALYAPGYLKPATLSRVNDAIVEHYKIKDRARLGPRRFRGRAQFQRHEHTITLAREGRPEATIVVPTGAPTPVSFAAQELKRHLDAMTGADYPILDAIQPTGTAIILGDCPQARAAGIHVEEIARDGYAVASAGQRIFIAGTDDRTEKADVLNGCLKPFGREASRYAMERALGDATWDFQRGTLYGVYRFLEELGVRWFFPGDKGTVIPTQPTLSFPAFSLLEEPAYLLRKVGRATWQWYILDVSAAKDMIDRREYEDMDWDGMALRLWLMRVRASSEWFAFNHRPPRMELEQRYGREHPEYFAIRPNGKRDLAPQPGRTGHLCYTEPGVVEITKRDIDAYFGGKTAKEMGFSAHQLALNPLNRGWPAAAVYGRTVSLLPHDSFIACGCEDCAPFIHNDGDRAGSHSELVWQFVTKMAAWMEQAHPDKLITCLAYASYSERPQGLTRLPENVVVGMCPANYARTHNDLDEASYQDLMRMVGEWSCVNSRPMLIWLHHLYRHRAPRRQGIPMLITGFYERLFRDLSAHANLMHVELDSDSIMLEHLNRYVMLKLLYNPALSAGRLVADYSRSFYGPAADIVLPVLRDIETRSARVGATRAGSSDVWENHFTRDVLAGYRRAADAVLQATGNTPHEEAGRLFSEYFIGAIERGRELYVRNVKQVAGSADATVTVRALKGDIAIDGRLTEEAWQRSEVRNFVNNIDGQKTQWKTEIRMLQSPEDLYFGFTCYDPGAKQLPTGEGEADSVEIFLDPDHDHDDYYWVWIDLGGRMLDWYLPGGGEPRDDSWHSGVQFATTRGEDRWVVEVRLPRAGMKDGMQSHIDKPWGANFGRSTAHAPRPEDRFSCWSPLIRGKFHQPDLFGHVIFPQ